MRGLAGLCLVLFLAACGDAGTALPAVDLQIRLEAGARTVRPGQGFTLDVVRTWRKGLDPSPWDDELLSPLVLQAQGVTHREDERRIQETRHFRAQVFSLADVSVPAVPFAGVPKEGGELRIAAAKPLHVRVEPELDPKNPGPPELPGDLLDRGFPWLLLMALLVALTALTLIVVRRRRDGAEEIPPEAPEIEIPPWTRAEQALAALQREADADPTAEVLAVAGIVRTYVGERFAVDAEVRTTDELEGVAEVGPVLRPCDRVKFAAHAPTRTERADLLERAVAFVRSTTP